MEKCLFLILVLIQLLASAFVVHTRRPFGQRNLNRQQIPLQAAEYALLFDCDGVILETEELHRLAYNEAFRFFGLTIDNHQVQWSVSEEPMTADGFSTITVCF